MSSFILPAATYNPYQTYNASLASPREHRNTLNTIIDDEPQDTPRLLSQFPRPSMLSPALSEDMPTPKGIQDLRSPRTNSHMRIPSPISEASSPYSDSAPWRQQRDSYDELYDVTDDEAEEVPLKCSASIKKIVGGGSARSSRGRYPSIIIPSPSAWPTIQKLQKSALSPMSPALATPLKSPAPGILSMIRSRQISGSATPSLDGSFTPSLDGSFTSEELDKLSCPATPDLARRDESVHDWLPPPQLHPEAMQTLNYLSTSDNHSESMAYAEGPDAEMQQVDQSYSSEDDTTPFANDDEDPLSALSIPSPGGFFSSLGSSARHTWSTQPAEDIIPSTTVAEQFYGVPWRQGSSDIVSRVVDVPSSLASGPPTAKALNTTSEEIEVTEIQRNSSIRTEYNADYQAELEKLASSNLDRTGSWLNAQFTYLSALVETSPIATSPTMDVDSDETSSANTRSRSSSLEDSSITSPSKKSVRFLDADGLASPATSLSETLDDKPTTPTKETVFAEAFEYLAESACASDAFIHRQLRADALHTTRAHIPASHRAALLGAYSLSTPARPAPPRPVSSFYTDDPTALKERIARAQLERQALDALRPAAWVLAAQKFLNGGHMLSSASRKALRRSSNPRVLDVGGQVIGDWAWGLCHDFPCAAVTTATTACVNSEIAGPENHKVAKVPNYWTFPFPSSTFDVVSARSLYALLRSTKSSSSPSSSSDEMDACLAECRRVLKPKGILEFSVLDSDILHAGPLARAASVEFGFNLQTRGYDPSPTKTFLPRLSRAGFSTVQRQWGFLPMNDTKLNWKEDIRVGGQGEATEKEILENGEVQEVQVGRTQDVEAMTGLVGAWAWEGWMVRLQCEMGS